MPAAASAWPPPQPVAPPPGRRPGRLTRLRERWRNASLKTSFMVYMLVFLLAALVLSTATGSLFGGLQNQTTADAYEVAGLYLYDKEADALVPARTVEMSVDGSSAFVQTMRNGIESIARENLSDDTNVMDASDYALYSGSVDSGSDEASGKEGLYPDASIANLPAYDAWARDRFDAWLAENPDSPYASFFATGTASGDGSPTEGLMTSAIGYYLNTPPSPGAQALNTLFGLLSFLMFPLWFGVCIFAAARRFYRKRLAPGLTVLDDAAAKIADQDLDFTVSYDRSNELGRLARSFETMRASLAESQRALWRTAEERKRLNAAFAHDLRTPLTILKGKIELLEARVRSGDASPEQMHASFESLSAQVERLERYVAAMSGLQKLEDRVAEPAVQPFDAVAEAVKDIGRTLCRRTGEAEGQTNGSDATHGTKRAERVAFALYVSARCDADRPTLAVDRSLVEEVVENLVGNAARFAAARVEARLDVRDGFLVLAVEDDGPGFSPEALAHGCAPFFSETPSKDHFGLGLNIAALLCDKHGGNLELDNRPEGGARATARFAMNFPAVDKR
ncbi:HAMP domain-containing histidine kinase [Gordonibacter massiliensis]|nr:HAMP domain-containing histidine kinase [Gordonibacter massiliensis (ex Traore et al. 2017)]